MKAIYAISQSMGFTHGVSLCLTFAPPYYLFKFCSPNQQPAVNKVAFFTVYEVFKNNKPKLQKIQQLWSLEDVSNLKVLHADEEIYQP